MPDEKLVAELAAVIYQARQRFASSMALAQTAIEWLAERGRLIPEGSKVREIPGVRLTRPDGQVEEFQRIEPGAAVACVAYHRKQIAAGLLGLASAEMLSRRQITTPWVSVPDDTWRPAKPGETPGSLVPGEGDVTVPEFVQPTCPECAPGASDPHDEPDLPHVHLTPYGYLIYAPKHLHVDWLEELRADARAEGRAKVAGEISDACLAKRDRLAAHPRRLGDRGSRGGGLEEAAGIARSLSGQR